MITRLLTTWYRIRSSLWALPLLVVVGGCALAFVALNIKLDVGGTRVWYLYSGTASQAASFLSSLVSAMITMATLAISITMVVLTLAAQQLGPRLIRSFMDDRRTQIPLGLFIGTVVYLMLILRGSYGDESSVPNLAVTVGTALVLVSIAALPFFVHHLAQSIIADNVVDRVGAQLDRDIRRLMPDEAQDKGSAPKTDAAGQKISLAGGGYVQAVDFESLADVAREADAIITMTIRAGHNVVPGGTAATVTPASAAGEALCNAVRDAVYMGRERTSVQDLEYSIHQLVEIAVRALSPGINDPYTANAVLDRLALSVALVMTRHPPQSVWRDEEGHVRLVANVSTFEGIADTAFHQIRQQAEGTPAVLIRLASNLAKLLEQAQGEHRRVLEKHLRLAVDTGRRTIGEEADMKDLEIRARIAG